MFGLWFQDTTYPTRLRTTSLAAAGLSTIPKAPSRVRVSLGITPEPRIALGRWRCPRGRLLRWDSQVQKRNITGDAGDWTRGLSHAKRTRYHCATSPVGGGRANFKDIILQPFNSEAHQTAKPITSSCTASTPWVTTGLSWSDTAAT